MKKLVKWLIGFRDVAVMSNDSDSEPAKRPRVMCTTAASFDAASFDALKASVLADTHIGIPEAMAMIREMLIYLIDNVPESQWSDHLEKVRSLHNIDYRIGDGCTAPLLVHAVVDHGGRHLHNMVASDCSSSYKNEKMVAGSSSLRFGFYKIRPWNRPFVGKQCLVAYLRSSNGLNPGCYNASKRSTLRIVYWSAATAAAFRAEEDAEVKNSETEKALWKEYTEAQAVAKAKYDEAWMQAYRLAEAEAEAKAKEQWTA